MRRRRHNVLEEKRPGGVKKGGNLLEEKRPGGVKKGGTVCIRTYTYVRTYVRTYRRRTGVEQ